MRPVLRLVLCASLSLAAAGCGSSVQVRTMTAPDAPLTGRHSFRVLPGPARRAGAPAAGADDPMVANSSANRALRERIVAAFQDRGYIVDERAPELAVAFYATARDRLDVTVWDYGYPFTPGWPPRPGPAPTITPYTEGSVIVDVVDPATRRLLWRGEGRAALSDDPARNVARLAKVAAAIVGEFPRAAGRVLAAYP